MVLKRLIVEGSIGLRPSVGPLPPQIRTGQWKDVRWTLVDGQKKRKKKRKHELRDASPRRESDTLVINTEESKYSDILKAIRNDAKFTDHGVDARSIRRICTD